METLEYEELNLGFSLLSLILLLLKIEGIRASAAILRRWRPNPSEQLREILPHVPPRAANSSSSGARESHALASRRLSGDFFWNLFSHFRSPAHSNHTPVT
uniref:Uncharacterized protein n=1 Tax=Nicotiana tabacum TaxID=4097 RepID=A0A1S3X8Y2_TOBAC|nr:PREDICTED: uncharacterized protein LOC107762415 [Nicotiana tabacum]